MAAGRGASTLQLTPTAQLPVHLSHRRAVSETVIIKRNELSHGPAFPTAHQNVISMPSAVEVSSAANSIDPDLGAWDIVSREMAAWQALDKSKVGPTGLRASIHSNAPGNASQFSFKSADSEGFTVRQRRANSDQEDELRPTALHLLSSTLTLPPDRIPGSLPSAFCYDGSFPFALRPDPRLISSLRLHSHYLASPALSHHARDPSRVDPWPDTYHGPSREDILAEEMSRRRRIEMLKLARAWEMPTRPLRSTPTSSKPSSLHPSILEYDSPRVTKLGTILQISRHRMRASSDDRASTHLYPFSPSSLELPHAPPPSQISLFNFPVLPEPVSSITSTSLKTRRRSRARPLKSYHAPRPYPFFTQAQPRAKVRWKIQSVELSDSHRLPIQPVKKLVVRQWQSIRSELRKNESRRSTKTGNDGVEMTAQGSSKHEDGGAFLEDPILAQKETRSEAMVSSSGDPTRDDTTRGPLIDYSLDGRKQPRPELPGMDGAGSETRLSLIEALHCIPDPEEWRVGPRASHEKAERTG